MKRPVSAVLLALSLALTTGACTSGADPSGDSVSENGVDEAPGTASEAPS